MPRLSDEPDIIKFSRVDVVSYEGEWDPDAYDPSAAQATLEDHIEEAVEAERLGWDGYLLTEHHFDGWTMAPSPNVLLTAIAMRTSRIRLGHAVQVLPVHNPYFLAEQYGMLDVLSGGRLEVGLGRGNFDFEWDRYEEDHADAAALFDDNLELLEKALTRTRFTHDGTHGIPRPSTLYPRPLQDPLPIWQAATSRASLQKVARQGHNLLGLGVPDDRQQLTAYAATAAEAGHRRGGANFGVLAKVVCAPTDREARRVNDRNREAVEEALASRGLSVATEAGRRVVARFTEGVTGSPQTVLERLAEVIEGTGARRLVLIVRLRGVPGEISRQTQRLLAEEVFPHLRHLPTPHDA